jgi:bifunctional UDP-N-acetylglucosamine pyrophosphorylase/glucosamine-1-phosphate N-acetyltransferase
MEYFGNNFGGIEISYAMQQKQLGTFDALLCAKKYLNDDPFLIVSGDDLYHKRDLAEVASSKLRNVVLAKQTATPERFGICSIGQHGFLTGIFEKPQIFCGDLANIGVYKLGKEIFDEEVIVAQNGEKYLAPMIGTLAKKHKVGIVKARFWHPIADLSDLALASEALAKSKQISNEFSCNNNFSGKS